MTRNQVAQMVLNALQSAVVEPDGNTINLTTPDGVVYTGKVNYVSVTSAKAFARAIGRVQATSVGSQNDGYIVELGERLYDGKLKLTDDYDPFGRPARNWEYDGKNVGIYAKKELMVFDHVGTVTGKDLYDLLGAKTIEDYALTVNLDGVKDPKIVRDEVGYDGDTTNIQDKHNVDYVFAKNDLNRNNKATIGATGTGVLTQVFVDHEADTIDIAIINTYLARADKDYDAKKEELAVTAYSITKHTASGEYVKVPKNGKETEAFKLAGEEFSAVKDAAKDSAFLLTVADGEVQSVVPAEVLSGVQISAFKKGDNVVVDGTTYKFDTTTGFDPEALKAYTDLKGNAIINLKDLTYNVYLDTYGNLIGVEEVDAVKNYVFITAIDLNDSNLVNGTADARAIFLDGTVDTIRVNMGKSAIEPYTNSTPNGGIHNNSILNTWCTFTKNNSDVYTLTQVRDVNAKGDAHVPGNDTNKTGLAQYHETVAAGEMTIDKKHITLKGKTAGTGDFARVYGDDKTVYLTAELDELINDGGTWGVISDVDTISTGIEATNLVVWNNAVAMAEADDTDTKATKPGDNGLDWSKGVYTLYNDDGVIIAAVVVGEDNGASKNLVYVHTSDVDWEAYNGNSASRARASNDGLFTWTRKVVSNGEEVTLTEVSDGDSYLARMEQYNWYQIKTNGAGEVIAAYKLPGVNDGSDLKDAKLTRYEDLALDYHYYDENKNGKQDFDANGEPIEIGEIAYTVQEGKGTVLYHNEKFINSYLRMSNRTLYVATDDQTGFIVNENVNYVLQQWNSNKKDTFIETGSGAKNLESVIKELNDRYGVFGADGKWTGKNYTYQISAILENGVASSVVIYDNNNDYVRPGDTGSNSIGNISVASNETNKIDGLGKNTSMEILASGSNTLKVEIIAPDWAKDANSADDLTVNATLMVDGRAYERIEIKGSDWTRSGATFSANESFTTLGSAIWNLTLDPDEHTFSVVLSDITWAKADVKYVYADGTAVPAAAVADSSGDIAIGSAADLTIKYDVNDDANYEADGQLTYKVTGAAKGNDAAELDGELTNDTAKAVNVKAGNGWVTVTIGGVKKAAVVTPDTYTVKANTATSGKVLFAVVDADKVPTDQAGVDKIAASEWKTSVSAATGKVVLIKSASSFKLTSVTAMETETGTAIAGGSITEIPTSTGVFEYTVADKDVTIKAIDTNEVTVEKFYVKGDGSELNILTDKDPSPAFTPEETVAFVVDYFKGVNGYTVVEDRDANNELSGVKVNGVAVALNKIKIADDLIWAVVDGKTVVSNANNAKLSYFVGADNTPTAVTVTADGATYKSYAKNAVVNGASVSDGDVIKTISDAALDTGGTATIAVADITITDKKATLTPDKVVADLTGALSQIVTGGIGGLFPDASAEYDRIKGYKVNVLCVELPQTASKWSKTVITDSAQRLYSTDPRIKEEDGKWVKTGNAVDRTNDDTVRELAIPVINDGEDIIIAVYIGDNENDIASATEPTYTLTIKTTGITFN
jgi:hypothetical protein